VDARSRGKDIARLGWGANKRAKNSEHDKLWNCQIEPAADGLRQETGVAPTAGRAERNHLTSPLSGGMNLAPVQVEHAHRDGARRPVRTKELSPIRGGKNCVIRLTARSSAIL
jgi:hypothetical protein